MSKHAESNPSHSSSPSPSNDEPLEPQGFEIWRIYSVLLRRWWLIAITTGLTLAGVATWTYRQTPVYHAEATVVIDSTTPQVLKGVAEVVDLGNGNYWSTKEYFETQYKILKSRAIAERVVARLGLDHDEDFLKLPSGLDGATRAALLKNLDPVDLVVKAITVTPVKDSRVVTIAIEDTSPQRAHDLANGVSEEYIEQNVDRKLESTRGASAWLAGQLGAVKKRLEDSERALYRFKVDHDVLSTSLEARQNSSSERLVAINDALTRAQLARAAMEVRREALQRIAAESKGAEFKAESFRPVADNLTINEMKREYFHLLSERADLLERYLPDFPRVVALDERVKRLKEDIAHQVEVVLASVEEDYQTTISEEKRLREMLESSKREALNVNSLEMQYSLLKREKDQNQSVYDLIVKREKEVDVAGLLRTNNIRMLDEALVPKIPIRPNPRQNIGLALLVGLVLGIGLVLGLEALDNTVKSQDDVEQTLRLPLLGILPSIPNPEGTTGRQETVQRDLFVSTHPKSSISECARAIRTSLLFSSPDRPFKVLLVASCGPREGKTTCSVSIATTMAQGGSRVLLVDGDMRRPRVHRTFGIPSSNGLSTLILGETTPEEAIIKGPTENLDVLPAGPVPPNPAELLQSARYAEVIADLARRYDRVIIDSPPVGVVTDALVMSSQADGLVLVLRAGSTPKKAASRGRRALLDVKAHIYGAVLNDVDLGSRVGQYYYYYRYGYYPSDKYPTQNAPDAKPGSKKDAKKEAVG